MKVPVIVYGPGMGDLGTRFDDYKSCLSIINSSPSQNQRHKEREALNKNQTVRHGKYTVRRSV